MTDFFPIPLLECCILSMLVGARSVRLGPFADRRQRDRFFSDSVARVLSICQSSLELAM